MLNSLGASFAIRFRHSEEQSDIEEAISELSKAVELTPDDHLDKPPRLNNLGVSFRTRFECLGELRDLEQAIGTFEDAARLTPIGHPDKSMWLSNLGGSFLVRYLRLEELDDLERAISKLQDAVELTPDGHPDQPNPLGNLGSSYLTRFQRLGDRLDLERAISHFFRASHSAGPASARFDASLLWIACARTFGHQTLLHAYSIALDLLPQLAWIGLSLPHRFKKLMGNADVVRDAAATALELGYPETAVEWLEQGRSVVWRELFQLRSSYNELFDAHPEHAQKLRRLSTELEQAGTTREQFALVDVTQTGRQDTVESPEQVANRHRLLAIERDKLIQDIRKLPNFERFLLHIEYSQLRASAHSGPIVILNAAQHRCDALVILSDVENVIHVPLPNFPFERSETLQALVKSLSRTRHTDRVGHRIPLELSSQWEPILSALWKCVVKPILYSLALVAPGKQTRIFWCPTGSITFLPVHAAGLYDAEYSQPGHKTFDFVVSSYIPTLSILAPSPEPQSPSTDALRFLVVQRPQSDGLSYLPGVEIELKRIRETVENSPTLRITLFEPSVGTVDEVLDLMKDADWVHFACHGIQDIKNPTESGLCLANERRLQLSNIIALRRSRGGFAFLSACQTATGDRALSDEAIHIAAGMLFAGFGGVVGTMWSISDRLAPKVARDVYEQLFSNAVSRPDSREASRALQSAVGRLQAEGVSFSEWIPFIHIGL